MRRPGPSQRSGPAVAADGDEVSVMQQTIKLNDRQSRWPPSRTRDSW
jgi:hypothetical protein